jgi:hypothetical protein
MREHRSVDTIDTASLPGYLDGPPLVEPRPPTSIRQIWRGLSALAEELIELPRPGAAPPAPSTALENTLPFTGRAHDLSATFVRMVEVPGNSLGTIVRAWWDADAKAGVLEIGRRLRLRRPEFRPEICGGWRLLGRLRRDPLWLLPPLAVSLELSPRLSAFSSLHLRPQRRVLPTWRYFRIGHALVDEIVASLTTPKLLQ